MCDKIIEKTIRGRKMTKKGSIDIRKTTYLALFTALVFLLQFISLFMRGPMFSLTFVLVPIVIAVALCGFGAGPWLGLVFGVAVLATGDANAFLAVHPFGTVVTVLLKGVLAGTAAAAVYCLLNKFNRYLAVAVAAVTAPIVNTGVFFLGCLTFFMDFAASLAPAGQGTVEFIVVGFIGINFIIEVCVNLILVPTIYRIIEIGKARFK